MNKFSRIFFILLVICTAFLLSTTSKPAKTQSAKVDSKKVASSIRSVIEAELDGLPERAAQDEVVAKVSKLSGVKKVQLLAEGEYLGELCEKELRPQTAYLAFPAVDSPDGGIFGGLYADSKNSVRAIIVPSKLAEATDPRVKDLQKSIDGKRLFCPKKS